MIEPLGISPATGVNRNLRSACVLLSAPVDPTSVSYGFTQATQVNGMANPVHCLTLGAIVRR